MIRIQTLIKQNYFRFNPGEFLPVYRDGHLANRREFHIYRIKWLMENYRVFWYQVTHDHS